MIALYILLGIALLLTLLCFVKLKFEALYSDELTLKLKVLFLTFTLVPTKKKVQKPKPEKQKKSKKPKKPQSKKKDKKPSYVKKLSSKKGVSGLLSMLSDLAKLAGTTLKGLFSKIVIEKFDIDVTVASHDAADTALKYGKLCGAFYSAVAVICGTAQCDDYSVNVTPDFDDEARMKVSADVRFYIRVAYVLKYALNALFKLLVIRYKR